MATIPCHSFRCIVSRCLRVALLLLVVFLAPGCASRRGTDLLEGRLRQQEDSLNEMNKNLASARGELAAAKMEADALRTQLASQGKKTILSEQAGALYSATGIVIDKFRSGGLDNDGLPGDEVITAAVVPRDRDGELVKLAGNIDIEVLDLSKPKDQQRLGHWSYDAAQSSEYWHRGFLGSGYSFKLPLAKPPENSQLVLHATLTAADGRRFDANETIRVSVPGSVAEKATEIVKGSQPARMPAAGGRSFLQPDSSETGRASIARSKSAPEVKQTSSEEDGNGQIEQLNFAPEIRPANQPGPARLNLTPGSSSDRKPPSTSLYPEPGRDSAGISTTTLNKVPKPVSKPASSAPTGFPDWAREDADLLTPQPPRQGPRAKRLPGPAPLLDDTTPAKPVVVNFNDEAQDEAALDAAPKDEAPFVELEPDTRGDRKARAASSLPEWAR